MVVVYALACYWLTPTQLATHFHLGHAHLVYRCPSRGGGGGAPVEKLRFGGLRGLGCNCYFKCYEKNSQKAPHFLISNFSMFKSCYWKNRKIIIDLADVTMTPQTNLIYLWRRQDTPK